MTFISFAQHLEDFVLFGALQDVEHGFYIDVGAHDPVVDSVTKAFYERGWSGINLEPVSSHFERLLMDRPRDTNLNIAASDADEVMHLYEIPDSGLSTLDREIAKSHGVAGQTVLERETRCRRLDDICSEHDCSTIHFLKVDVEGAERKVLAGMSFTRYRPWIVVVEATMPLSHIETHDLWEDLLVSRDYNCAYFDGLNRYYVAEERAQLAEGMLAQSRSRDYVHYSRRSLRLASRLVRRKLRNLLGRPGA